MTFVADYIALALIKTPSNLDLVVYINRIHAQHGPCYLVFTVGTDLASSYWSIMGWIIMEKMDIQSWIPYPGGIHMINIF